MGTATGINQLIEVLGLRNPFTFAVQPGTGTIYINDVGEITWEEIDQSIPGANFGWSGGNTDGFGQSPPGPGVYHDPLLAYNHDGGPAGGGIAIVGGAFYNPATPTFPASYIGKYFYGDLGGGWIRVFDPAQPGSIANPDTSTGFATGLTGSLVGLTFDSGGSLYALAQDGTVTKISYLASQVTGTAPTIDEQPTGSQVNAGRNGGLHGPRQRFRSLELSVAAPTRALWQHVGNDTPTYTIASASSRRRRQLSRDRLQRPGHRDQQYSRPDREPAADTDSSTHAYAYAHTDSHAVTCTSTGTAAVTTALRTEPRPQSRVLRFRGQAQAVTPSAAAARPT